MKKFLLLSVLLFAVAANSFSQRYADYQDVVYLKNGSIIRGIIIEQVPLKSIKIETIGGNVFAYYLDEIEKITKEPRFAQEVIKNQEKLSTSTGLKKGYRGIVELSPVLPWGVRLDVINGYQFNPYLSVGAGVGLHFDFESGLLLPLFADVRVNFLNRKVSPYISLGIGYSFALAGDFDGGGVYFSPTFGVRFKLSEKTAMNVGLGLGLQGYRYYYNDYYYNDYGEYHSNGVYYNSYIEPVLNLNIGFSF